jgi:Phasin protein
MSKRNPATKSKHRRDPKTAAKARRAALAVIRSPKENRVQAALPESIPERSNDPEAPVGDPTTALQQEAPFAPATASQDDRNTASIKEFDISSATANVRALQEQWLEVVQANMQFAFEFAQRLAMIRSPVEFLGVTAEFTSKRNALLLKHLKEIAKLSLGGRTALWGTPQGPQRTARTR